MSISPTNTTVWENSSKPIISLEWTVGATNIFPFNYLGKYLLTDTPRSSKKIVINCWQIKRYWSVNEDQYENNSKEHWFSLMFWWMLKSNLILNNVSWLYFYQNPHIFEFVSGIHYDKITPTPSPHTQRKNTANVWLIFF